jgi:hypothetical protein
LFCVNNNMNLEDERMNNNNKKGKVASKEGRIE